MTQATLRITLDGAAGQLPEGATVLDAGRALRPEGAPGLLAALRGGECLELNAPLRDGDALRAVTYQQDEGRAIYRRTLRFVLMLAMKRLLPGKRVRFLHSVGYGEYLRVLDGELTHPQVRALEAEMRAIVAADLPLFREEWATADAKAYFAAHDQPDTAALLEYRQKPTIAMYRLEDMYGYLYGAMLPSTGYAAAFALKPHFPGLVLLAPEPEDASRPQAYQPCPKHLRVFTQSQRWCGILGAQNVADVNRMIETGRMREFIRVNEALHDKNLAAIADEIDRREARVVLIFGPSSSGKTTFAHRLSVHLRAVGLTPKLVSLDDFYKDRDVLPLEADGTPDLETVDALDTDLLSECVESLLCGQEAAMPRFDFTTARRKPERVPLRMGPRDVLVVEGIHALNDRITREIPEEMMYGVYVSALHCLNLDDHNRIRTTDVRLLRRIVRDVRTRSTSPQATIDMWPKVRAGEERWIFPYQEKADVVFNTSLHYELPILKACAYEHLRAIPPEEPQSLVAHRLMKFLNYLLPVGPEVLSEIPPLSILREFVGECAFYDRH